MKNFRFWTALLLLAPPLGLLNGCGGGGGSSPSPTATATPVPTSTVGGRVLVVRVRDRAGNAVEGIVTLGTSVMATENGSATFNRDVPSGLATLKVEVDGDTTSASAMVKSSGTTFIAVTITPRVTPAPTATLPPPPFGL